MSKILAVWGATGNQGGSVISAVLDDPEITKEYNVRGITRNIQKDASKALAAKGVEMVAADMSSAEAAAPGVKGAHTVFIVTNFWESMKADVEIAQGKAVTDACKAAGVKHIIFSSLLDTTEITDGRLPNISHFEGKATIEKYIRESGVPASFFLAGMYMSNFFQMIQKKDDGSYAMALPVSGDKAEVPLIDTASDTGKFVAPIIKNFPSLVGKRVFGAVDYYTPNRLLEQFSEVMGKPAHYNQVPNEVFKSFLPPAMAQELLENWLLPGDAGYYGGGSLKDSLAIVETKLVTWKDFVAANKEKWA